MFWCERIVQNSPFFSFSFINFHFPLFILRIMKMIVFHFYLSSHIPLFYIIEIEIIIVTENYFTCLNFPIQTTISKKLSKIFGITLYIFRLILHSVIRILESDIQSRVSITHPIIILSVVFIFRKSATSMPRMWIKVILIFSNLSLRRSSESWIKNLIF